MPKFLQDWRELNFPDAQGPLVIDDSHSLEIQLYKLYSPLPNAKTEGDAFETIRGLVIHHQCHVNGGLSPSLTRTVGTWDVVTQQD